MSERKRSGRDGMRKRKEGRKKSSGEEEGKWLGHWQEM